MVAKLLTLIREFQDARKGVRRREGVGKSRVIVWRAAESRSLGISLCSPF